MQNKEGLTLRQSNFYHHELVAPDAPSNMLYSYQLRLHVTGQTSFLRTTDEIIRVYSFLELGNPQQVTHLLHVWDLLLPLAYRHQEGLMVHSTSSERHMLSGVNETPCFDMAVVEA